MLAVQQTQFKTILAGGLQYPGPRLTDAAAPTARQLALKRGKKPGGQINPNSRACLVQKFVLEHPGSLSGEIARGVGCSHMQASSALYALITTGRVSFIEPLGVKKMRRYSAMSMELMEEIK